MNLSADTLASRALYLFQDIKPSVRIGELAHYPVFHFLISRAQVESDMFKTFNEKQESIP
jgi:hypothetical protein